MADELILETHQKPNYFNKEAIIGALLLPLFGGGAISLAIGALAGAFVGKKRMEHEAHDGKHVSENHSWLNKETLLGALTGHLVGKAVAISALFVNFSTMVATGTSLTAAMAATAPLALPAMLMVLGSSLIGGYIGNKLDERHHAAEYEQAKTQAIVRHMSETVSPEAGKAMEYAMEHQKSWAQDVVKDRMLQQSRELH